jgi:RNA polymerase sigma factor (sigma-70 family)
VNRPTGLHVLIRRSAAGETQAQAELYELLRQPLHRHILNQFQPTLDEEDAWEITDQTVLQIYLSADHYHGAHDESSAWKWAYQIARNQALKRLKVLNRSVPVWQTRNQELLDEDEDALFDAIFPRYSPFSIEEALEEQVFNHLIWEAARACLLELNERERRILVMRYVEERTLDEIGAYYHVNRSRVYQILMAIHLKLRKRAKLDEV